jgi:hypothetical protein
MPMPNARDLVLKPCRKGTYPPFVACCLRCRAEIEVRAAHAPRKIQRDRSGRILALWGEGEPRYPWCSSHHHCGLAPGFLTD